MDPLLPPAPSERPRSWRSFVDDLADRLGTSPAAVIVVGLVAIAAVLYVAVAWGRSGSEPAELSIPYAADAEPADQAPGPTSSSTTAGVEVLAHAAGAVAHPGVYALPPGSRVGDLLTAAGGPLGEADVDRLNLAAPLTDGERVYVPRMGEALPPAVVGPDGGAAESDGPVDLNTADASALEDLPGVGPATAAAIVDHRERHGPFQAVDDLLDVRGIGDAKLAALRDLVTV